MPWMPYVIFCRLRPEVKKFSRTNHRGFVYAKAYLSFYISIYIYVIEIHRYIDALQVKDWGNESTARFTVDLRR